MLFKAFACSKSYFFNVSSLQSRTIMVSACLRRPSWVPEKPLQAMPADFKENPERDVVNFPHPVRQMYPPKTRLGFIPDSWFNAFYNITGVTGPYVLTGGLALIVVQKELLGPSHEMVMLATRLALFAFLAKKFGHLFARWLEAGLVEQENFHRAVVDTRKKLLQDSIEEAKSKISGSQALVPFIYNAKRENLDLQVEADYRRRVATVYSEVKKRLDYMVDVVAVKKKYQNENMIDWIVNEVKKSITPEQEKLAIQHCIQRLQELSQRKNLSF